MIKDRNERFYRVNKRMNGIREIKVRGEKNHSTQDSRVVPHRGTNWAAPWLTSQIGRDAVLSRSYGRGCLLRFSAPYVSYSLDHTLGFNVQAAFTHPTRKFLIWAMSWILGTVILESSLIFGPCEPPPFCCRDVSCCWRMVLRSK